MMMCVLMEIVVINPIIIASYVMSVRDVRGIL